VRIGATSGSLWAIPRKRATRLRLDPALSRRGIGPQTNAADVDDKPRQRHAQGDLKPTRKLISRLGRRFKLSLVIAATDAAQNIRKVTKTIRIR